MPRGTVVAAAAAAASATVAATATAGRSVRILRVYTSKACTLCQPVKHVCRKVASKLELPYQEVRSGGVCSLARSLASTIHFIRALPIVALSARDVCVRVAARVLAFQVDIKALGNDRWDRMFQYRIPVVALDDKVVFEPQPGHTRIDQVGRCVCAAA